MYDNSTMKEYPKHGQKCFIKDNDGNEVVGMFTTFYFPPNGAFVVDNSMILSFREWKPIDNSQDRE